MPMQVGFGGDKCMGSNVFCFDHPEFQSFLMHGGGGGLGRGGGTNAHSQVTSTYMYRQPGYGSRNLGS